MGITVQQVGVLTCASRLCLRSFSIHRQLLDIELYCHQPLQVLDLIYKKYHGNPLPWCDITSNAAATSGLQPSSMKQDNSQVQPKDCSYSNQL